VQTVTDAGRTVERRPRWSTGTQSAQRVVGLSIPIKVVMYPIRHLLCLNLKTYFVADKDGYG
jgi:hypothetical protein